MMRKTDMIRSASPAPFSVAATILLLILPGCQSVPTVSPMQKQVGAEDITAKELQIRIHEFANHFAVVINDATERIRARTADPAIRKEALGVRMRSISAVQNSVYHSDPLVAVLDTWVLIIQMRDLSTGETGWNRLGEHQPILTNSLKLLEKDIEEIAKTTTTGDDFQKLNQQVEDWVDRHPLDPFMGRRSILPLYAEMYPRPGKGAFSAVRGMESTMSDLADQVSAYVGILPFQARWQAEYLIEDLLQRDDLAAILNSTVKLTDALEEAVPLVEQTPDLIARERKAVLEAIRDERAAVLAAVDDQRVETLEEIRGERMAILDAVTAERIAIMSDLARERDITLQELEALTLKLLDGAGTRSQGMIDYVFYKMMWLLAVAGVFILFAGFLGLLGLRWILRGYAGAGP